MQKKLCWTDNITGPADQDRTAAPVVETENFATASAFWAVGRLLPISSYIHPNMPQIKILREEFPLVRILVLPEAIRSAAVEIVFPYLRYVPSDLVLSGEAGGGGRA